MNKKITVEIFRKFLWFCGIGPIPAPLLWIARHTHFVAICGVRALENAQSRAVTGFELATTAPQTFVAICGVREVIRAAASSSGPIPAARHEKKSKSSCAPRAMRVIMPRFLAARFFRHAARGLAS